ILVINGKKFNSRLLLGTGKYPNVTIQKQAVDASEAEILTFTVRRLNIYDSSQANFLELIDLETYDLLPNTAGASDAQEAVRHAKLAHASGSCEMIKVEIIGCQKTLLPDPVETLKDRKSTRLNSSHVSISYAVFCLKKKT